MYEKLLNKYAINQVAYIVEDLEKAARDHSALFGSGPFVYLDEISYKTTMYRGKEIPLSMEVAYAAFGDLQIELIKPTSEGLNVYTESGQYGFHHFSIWVDDFEGALEDFKEAGFEPAMLMTSGGGLVVAYVDCTEVWGHFVEIHAPQPYLVDLCKGLAKDWDGTNPYRKLGA
ncbi:MAG: VOC family protein [Actinobacteria bacterium]|nr:VOC family protein [Actinomycetota bacterium]